MSMKLRDSTELTCRMWNSSQSPNRPSRLGDEGAGAADSWTSRGRALPKESNATHPLRAAMTIRREAGRVIGESGYLL